MLTWWVDEEVAHEAKMMAVGGVMAGVRRYQSTLGPFPSAARAVRFRFRCTYRGCSGGDICCSRTDHLVELTSSVTS